MGDEDDKRIRELINAQLELIGINASSGESRERTRANFAILDSLNNQRMRDALILLNHLNNPKVRDVINFANSIDADQLKKDLDFLRDFAQDKKDRRKAFWSGASSSVGEWIGRGIAAAIGIGASWFYFGRH
jgi:pyruvate kinase